MKTINIIILDKKLVKLLAFFYGVVSLINYGIAFLFTPKSLICYTATNLPITIIDYLIVMIFMILVAKSIKKSIHKVNESWFYIGVKHFLLSLLLVVIITFIVSIYVILIQKISNEVFNLEILNEIINKTFELNFMVYFAMIFCVYSYYYFKMGKLKEKEKEVLQVQLVHTKLSMLTSNLQPHFLFNSLNNIVSLIDLNKEEAKKMIVELSSLLRDVLKKQNSVMVGIGEELMILEKYIQTLRLGGKENILFEKTIQNELKECKIPYLLLQPIVENAVKHGRTGAHKKLHLKLSIFKKLNEIIITIENNGKPLKNDFINLKKNIGIGNTIERLKTIYKDNFEFDIRNLANEEGVEVKIIIPYEI